jgi:hypothetical protein
MNVYEPAVSEGVMEKRLVLDSSAAGGTSYVNNGDHFGEGCSRNVNFRNDTDDADKPPAMPLQAESSPTPKLK